MYIYVSLVTYDTPQLNLNIFFFVNRPNFYTIHENLVYFVHIRRIKYRRMTKIGIINRPFYYVFSITTCLFILRKLFLESFFDSFPTYIYFLEHYKRKKMSRYRTKSENKLYHRDSFSFNKASHVTKNWSIPWDSCKIPGKFPGKEYM